jgi:molybdate transport system substrate-binding protein
MSRTAFTIYFERVGHVLARVEADLGFQQVSEILPVKTFKLVRMLPAELRKPFYFSAAIGAHCTRPDRVARVKQFLRFLASTEAALAIKQTEPGAVASAHLAYGA